MEVILLEKVHNLGKLGDKVKVKAGYGRNFLIPQQKAVPANAANVAKMENMRAELEQKQAESLAQAQARAATLADKVVTILARAGDEGKLFGSIGTLDIAEALTGSGTAVAKREVRLPNGPLRILGEHVVDVSLHTDITVSIKVQINPETATA